MTNQHPVLSEDRQGKDEGDRGREPIVFEPHNGYGSLDPDGEPWPFGYISEGYGRPIFELSPITVWPYDELYAHVQRFVAAPELYEAAKAVVDRWDTPLWKDVEPTGHVINRLRTALRKAEGR